MTQINLLKNLGLFICFGFILLDPWMIQNPMTPYLNGIFGKLQIVDLLIPLIFVYLLVYVSSTALAKKAAIPIANNLLIAGIVCILVLSLFSGYLNSILDDAYVLNILKMGYLLSIYFIFSYFISSNPLILDRLITALAFIFLISALISIVGYFIAYFTQETNSLAKVYEYFPYIETPTRMLGTFGPTSKVFGFYMFLMSLILFLYRDKINFFFYGLLVFLILVCAILTISRVSVWILMFWLLVFLNNFNKDKYLDLFLIFSVFCIFLLFQILTIFHFGDVLNPIFSCTEEYSFGKNQYYGWLDRPYQCKVSGEFNYTFSSYFLMKVAAFRAWLDMPFFGNGLTSFELIWINFALDGNMPMWYTEYVFQLVQNTFLTIMVEQGIISLFLWLGLFLYPLYLVRKNIIFKKNSFIILMWLVFILIIMIDLDIQNFRFTYYLFPVIHALLGFSSLKPNTAR